MKYSILAAAVLLGACTTSHPVDDSLAMPAAWRYASTDTQNAPVPPEWWSAFGNAELNGLVDTAMANSFDLAAAYARVDQARAQARVAGAALLPNVSAFADASRQSGFMVNNTIPGGNAFDLGVAASYELDFWGRNRALRESVIDEARATDFDRATVMVTLTSGVVSAWLNTVALRERERIAEQSLDTAQRVLSVTESQLRAGHATPLDTSRQRGLVAARQRTIALLAQQANDNEAVLAALLGVPASTFAVSTRSLDDLWMPPPNAGLPSTIVTRRPDVAAAEARLAAAHANVDAARAAMLPTITLTGSVGTGSDRIQRIFDNPLYTVAAGLTAPIFDAGSLAASRDMAVAKQRELLASYRQTIVTALGDVERALNADVGAQAQKQAQDQELQEARRTLMLAESRYRAGAETSLTVLDAQRTLFDAEDVQIQMQLSRLLAAVLVARAAGGGWQLAHQLYRADAMTVRGLP
jgi:outer membrane protein, multidrug efflux system